MQLVNQLGAQVLADGGDAAAQAHVAPARRRERLLERRVNAVGDEAELGAPRHLERRPGVVRQDEDRRVIRRLLAPPALPALVGPGPAHRAQHVAPEDPRADALASLFGRAVVDPGLAPLPAAPLPPQPRVEEPLPPPRAPHPPRSL